MAPHDPTHGSWRLYDGMRSATAPVEGPLTDAATRLPTEAAICLIAPLSRCITLATDIPPLRGAKLQQALAGALEDRLSSSGGPQHFAAGPMQNGRILEAAACDAVWLRRCIEQLTAARLRVMQVVPEAVLLSNCSAWWGQLQADHSPAWLMRMENGEALRAMPSWLESLFPLEDEKAYGSWQWFADPTGPAPSLGGNVAPKPMSADALLRRAIHTGWDLQQFAFKPADGAARFLSWCAGVNAQRSGRFALAALVMLILINVLGLNLYAAKQRREIDARHIEMERIVAQALPGAPRLMEPAVQLEAAWQRVHGAGNAGTAMLLNQFAQHSNPKGLLSLDISASTLRATFTDTAALERSMASCQSAMQREPRQRAGVRCLRDGDRFVMEVTLESATLSKDDKREKSARNDRG